MDGIVVGAAVGPAVGASVGEIVGDTLGGAVGVADGAVVGAVGESVVGIVKVCNTWAKRVLPAPTGKMYMNTRGSWMVPQSIPTVLNCRVTVPLRVVRSAMSLLKLTVPPDDTLVARKYPRILAVPTRSGVENSRVM